MPKPRYAQVSLEATPCYHCISRCVRHSWLCGENYEHRRRGFSDALIAVISEFNGCDLVKTFDKKAVRVGMTLL